MRENNCALAEDKEYIDRDPVKVLTNYIPSSRSKNTNMPIPLSGSPSYILEQ